MKKFSRSKNIKILLILLGISIFIFLAVHILEEKEMYELSTEMVKEGERYYQKKEYKKAKMFFDRALKRYNQLIFFKIVKKEEIKRLEDRIKNDPILQKVAKGYIYYNGKWVNEKQLEALMKEKRRLKQKIDVYLKTAKFFGSIEDIENNITIYQDAVKDIENSPFKEDEEIKQLKKKLISKIIFLSEEAAKKYKKQGNLRKTAYYYELILRYTDNPSVKKELFNIYMKNLDEYLLEGRYIKGLEVALKAKNLNVDTEAVLPKIEFLLSKIDLEEINLKQIKDPYVYFVFAKKAFNRFDILEAKKFVQKSLELDPENKDVLILYSKILYTIGEYDRAKNILKNLISKEGDIPEALIILGEVYLKKGNYQKAISYLQKVKNKREVKDILFKAYKNLGLLKMKEGLLKEAEKYLLEALKIKDDPQIYLSLGEIKFAQKKYKEAEKYYTEAVKIEPSLRKNVKEKLSVIYVALGKMERNRNRCPQAIAYLKKAVSYGGENPEILATIAECYEKIGKPRAALTYYKKLKDKKAKEREALLYIKLGEEAYKQKKYFTALKNFNRAVSLNRALKEKLKDRIVSAYIHIGKNYYSQKEFKKALQYFSKAIKEDPSQREKLKNYLFNAYLYLGKEHFKSGMLSTAFNYFKQAEKINSTGRELLYYMGMIFMAEHNYKKTAQYFEKYVSKYGENPEIVSTLATIYGKLGNLKKAKHYAEKITDDPKYSKVAYYIIGAYSLYYEKNPTKALQFFLKAENRGYKKGELYYYIGKIYYDRKNYLRAITYFTKALERGYRKEKVYYLRALAYLNLKDYRKAINDLSYVIKLNPENGKAYFLRGKLYYEHGNYVRGEYRKAIEDLEKAASMGVKEAVTLLEEAKSKR